MKILQASLSGMTRMSRSSMLVIVMWLFVILASLPATIVMEQAVRSDIGSSLVHEDLRRGLELGWLEEFHGRAGDLGRLLTPVRVSSAMWMENLELWLNGEWLSENRGLAAIVLVFLLSWIFLQGGVLEQLATPGERFARGRFLSSAGAYFFRFLRIAGAAGVAYFGVYRLARWLFPAIKVWTRDVTTEGTFLAVNLIAAALVATLMVTTHLLAEFAKIATVRESRRSMVLAIFRSARQVTRHPLQAFGLYAVMGLLLILWQMLYFWMAPGVQGASRMATVGAVLSGQILVIGRWVLRIARFGAEIHMFDQWTLADSKGRRQLTNQEEHSGRS